MNLESTTLRVGSHSQEVPGANRVGRSIRTPTGPIQALMGIAVNGLGLLALWQQKTRTSFYEFY